MTATTGVATAVGTSRFWSILTVSFGGHYRKQVIVSCIINDISDTMCTRIIFIRVSCDCGHMAFIIVWIINEE